MLRPITDWLQQIEKNTAEAYDNVFLFTGAEGSGKSNTAVQIFARLDPTAERLIEWSRNACRAARDAYRSSASEETLARILHASKELQATRRAAMHMPKNAGFDVGRIVFTQEALFRRIDDVPQGGAFLWDEADVNRRKAMRGDLLEVIDTLQTNRGQLLKLGLCFPRGGSADRQVLERIRWLCHHPQRGIVEITRYWTEEKRTKDGIETVLRWKNWGRYAVAANSGPFWNSYSRIKEAHMHSTRRRKSGMVLDVDAIRPLVRAVRQHSLDREAEL